MQSPGALLSTRTLLPAKGICHTHAIVLRVSPISANTPLYTFRKSGPGTFSESCTHSVPVLSTRTNIRLRFDMRNFLIVTAAHPARVWSTVLAEAFRNDALCHLRHGCLQPRLHSMRYSWTVAIPIIGDAGYAREAVWNGILFVFIVPYHLIDHVLRKVLNLRHALGSLLCQVKRRNLYPSTRHTERNHTDSYLHVFIEKRSKLGLCLLPGSTVVRVRTR